MTSLAEYFAKHRPQPVWDIGDRVFGRWNKIPFIGTVGVDNMVSEIEGPRVSVFLDLPIVYNDKIHNIIFVKQKDLKRLKDLDDTAIKKPQPRAGKKVDKKSNGSSTSKNRR